MKSRYACLYCGCDALEPDEVSAAFTCLVCLRRQSAERVFRKHMKVTVVGWENMPRDTAYVLDMRAWSKVLIRGLVP